MRPRVLLGLLGLLLPALAAVPVGTASADPSGGRSTAAAARALANAQALFDPPARLARRAAGPTYARPDATGVLRDLALHLDELGAADRRTADRILARPTDGASDPDGFGYANPAAALTSCKTEHFCVHWVPDAGDPDAPPATDANGVDDGDGVPDQVELTAQVFEQVWAAEVGTDTAAGQLGYRAPMSDGGTGDDAKLDVYLVDSGASDIYGYCAPDTAAPHTNTGYAGYCAVDNDFSTTQFRADPLVSLQVTAAHEFFHAVQFGYDATEDLWLMESTAAWIEDEVFDAANDNYQYFKASPLGRPGIPLDYFENNPDSPYYYPQYGGWVFWKFLEESFRDPGVVRDVWERAARTGGYSLSALRGALAARGTTFTDVFARFGAVNRYPGKVYSEGRAYPAAPLARTFTLGNRNLTQKALKAKLSHLTNLSVRYRPAKTLRARALRVALNMPDTVRGSAATVVVHFRNGDLSRRRVSLDRSGAGQVKVPFTRRKVAAVDLTLTDASTRYACWQNKAYYFGSCYGIPRDDQLITVFSAKAVR